MISTGYLSGRAGMRRCGRSAKVAPPVRIPAIRGVRKESTADFADCRYFVDAPQGLRGRESSPAGCGEKSICLILQYGAGRRYSNCLIIYGKVAHYTPVARLCMHPLRLPSPRGVSRPYRLGIGQPAGRLAYAGDLAVVALQGTCRFHRRACTEVPASPGAFGEREGDGRARALLERARGVAPRQSQSPECRIRFRHKGRAAPYRRISRPSHADSPQASPGAL